MSVDEYIAMRKRIRQAVRWAKHFHKRRDYERRNAQCAKHDELYLFMLRGR